ncbi:hypothetical protein Tco_0882165 [Tanacetum coccineum]
MCTPLFSYKFQLPITTIPVIQPTHPSSPHITSPSHYSPHYETEGPSFEPSHHRSQQPTHAPEIQQHITSEEAEQLRNMLELVPRLVSRVESLEKELSDTKQTLGTVVLKLVKKVKRLENKLKERRQREESEEEKDAEDEEVHSQADKEHVFATPEKSKDSGEVQEEQISPSTIEAAQILTDVASKEFKGSQAPPGSKLYRRKPKSAKTTTKVLIFEEPQLSPVNTASIGVNTGSTPQEAVNTGSTPPVEVNAGETEPVQRREGKTPMTEEDLQAEVQASKRSKELEELANLEAAQRLQAAIDAEAEKQIHLDELLATRMVEEEDAAADRALTDKFDLIQARMNADKLLAEKLQSEEREQYTIEERAKFLHDTIAAQRKLLSEQRYAAIRAKPPTKAQLRNQMITYLKHVGNKKHAELKSKSFEEIQVFYEKLKQQDQIFVGIGSEADTQAVKKMNEKAAKDKQTYSGRKRSRVEETFIPKQPEKTFGKRKKKMAKRPSNVEQENINLKSYLKIDPLEDATMDYEVLDKHFPIMNWESRYYHTDSQGNECIYFLIHRSDGSSRWIKTLAEMITLFDRQDLIELYHLVMQRFETITPEGVDLVLWGDLKMMFEASADDDLWKNQDDWEIESWNLYENSGVHILVLEDGTEIYMLAERRYPLTRNTLISMLEFKLTTTVTCDDAYELLRFIQQQIDELGRLQLQEAE